MSDNNYPPTWLALLILFVVVVGSAWVYFAMLMLAGVVE